MSKTNNQFSFLDYTGLSLFWSKVKKIISDNESATATSLNNLDTRVNNLEDAISDQIISKTYAELKTLRDNGQLVPGQQYRITDYTCTTKQAGTTSARHVFDIIVTADSENVLNEEARAVLHTGDGYFSTCDLNAWKLWYSLDNDTARFAWADNSASGRGVIYRMIDEFGNDCPYDFKNIQFYRQWSSNNSLWSIISDANTTGAVPCYTFSSDGDGSATSFDDISLDISKYVLGNVIGQYYNKNVQTLNNNCFFGYYIIKNTFEDDCYNNTMNYVSRYNTFGRMCHDNIFDYQCSSNILGNVCYNNIFNFLCVGNHLGDFCIENTLGVICGYNSFGNACSYIKFSYSSTGYACDYYQNNHFGDGCQYICLSGDDTGSKTQQVQNYNFAQGTSGTNSNYLTIEGKRNRTYETYISKDKDGVIKESVIAEKLDKMIKISYNDLVALRNNSKLVPGQQYRITDYTCTTRQDKTISAGHKFDIIVTADSTNKLNEEARAIQHTGDTYFADCNLSAWKIWYCLDNDSDRFTWALGNEKYITIYNNPNSMTYYARYLKTEIIDGTTYDLWDFGSNGGYFGTSITTGQSYDLIRNDNGTLYLYNSGDGKIIDGEGANGGKGVIYRMIDEWNNDVPYDFKNIQYTGSWGYYAYTFNWINDGTDNSCEDLSVAQFAHPNDESGYNHTCANIIKPCGENTNGVYNYPFKLNQCIFLNTESHDSGLFYGCYFNTFGNDCYNNSFGNCCYSNSFGHGCNNNSFGNYCYYNSFGNYCYSNSFGHSCKNNSFGNYCSLNSFGYNYIGNSFGHRCNANSFGNYCYNNSFGNNCTYIKFASNSSASTKYNYYQNNHFGDGCQYILFKGTETASYSTQVQNYNFAQGLQGTSSTYLSIPGKRSKAYDTTVSMHTDGKTICGYCLAVIAQKTNSFEILS